MPTRPIHRRIGRTVAVVVAGSIVGVAGTLAIVAAAEHPAQPADRPQAPERAAIAEWARSQNLTGLSPASLGAPHQDLDVDARRAAELAAIIEFAVAEGLSGLSPASLRPIDD